MLNVHTELEVNMTVRITSRDQITGADKGKLNALFAAVEALGGTIDYPVDDMPVDDQWTLTNAAYQNKTLSYQGGTVTLDFGNGVEAVPMMHAHRPVEAQNIYRFVVPSMSGVEFINTSVSTEADNFVAVGSKGPFSALHDNGSGLKIQLAGAGGQNQITVPVQVGYHIGVSINPSALIFNISDADDVFIENHEFPHDFGGQPLFLWTGTKFSDVTDSFNFAIEYIELNHGNSEEE